MNSFAELNAVGASVIEVDDTRPATVIFDKDTRYYSLETLVNYVGTSVGFESSINIDEIINYSTANVRFRVEPISSGANPGTITFASMPNGLTLTQVGNVYTVSGIRDRSQWLTIKGFTWTLDNLYTSETLYYLKLTILYFDQNLNAEQIIQWNFYDEDYYFDAILANVFNVSADAKRMRFGTASLSSNFRVELGVATCASIFAMSVSGDVTVPVDIMASEFTFVNTPQVQALYEVYTLNEGNGFTRFKYCTFNHNLNQLQVIAHNGSNWGIAYYDWNRLTDTATYSGNFIDFIYGAPVQTWSSIGNWYQEPSPNIDMTTLRQMQRMQTTDDGGRTVLNANLTYINNSPPTSRRNFYVQLSFGLTSGDANDYPSITSNGVARAYSSGVTITVFNYNNSSTTTHTGNQSVSYPVIQYESSGKYWLCYINTRLVGGTQTWYDVKMKYSTNLSTWTNISDIISVNSSTGNPMLPLNLRFDKTGTKLFVLRGDKNNYYNGVIEVYSLSGTTWSLSSTLNLTTGGGDAAYVLMSGMSVSSNARNVYTFTDTSSSGGTTNHLLFENGVQNIITDFNTGGPINSITQTDRYIIKTFPSSQNFATQSYQAGSIKIYRYLQG